MSESLQDAGDGVCVRRAVVGEHPRIVELQKVAYAVNRVRLGREPLPLLAEYDEIFAMQECWVALAGSAPQMAEDVGCDIVDLVRLLGHAARQRERIDRIEVGRVDRSDRLDVGASDLRRKRSSAARTIAVHETIMAAIV